MSRYYDFSLEHYKALEFQEACPLVLSGIIIEN
jgi:hypothetical protein